MRPMTKKSILQFSVHTVYEEHAILTGPKIVLLLTNLHLPWWDFIISIN